MLYHAGVSKDNRADALLNFSLVNPIFRSQWEIRKMGCIVIKLDTGDHSM